MGLRVAGAVEARRCPATSAGMRFAERVADGGRVTGDGVARVIDRVGGEQVRGGVDGGVPVAEVDLGLAVDGADVRVAGFVVPDGVGAGVVPEFYGVFPVVAGFGVGWWGRCPRGCGRSCVGRCRRWCRRGG